jgi:hypothetical protein
MANSLYTRLAYIKIMLNSYYGGGLQSHKTTYDEISFIKSRIKVIELRKSKIEKIIKNA